MSTQADCIHLINNPFICSRGHPMIDSVLFCSKCGKKAFITHSCYSCQYHLCVSCISNWNTTVNVTTTSNVTVEPKKQEEVAEDRDAGFPCNQCKNKIKYGKTNNRNPICYRCKKNGHMFTYWCKTCDLDICEDCVKAVTEEMKAMMGNFMNRGMSNMGQMNSNVPPVPGRGGMSNMTQGPSNSPQQSGRGGMGGFGFHNQF